MKKLITVLCSLLLCFGITFVLTGCNSNNLDNALSVSAELTVSNQCIETGIMGGTYSTVKVWGSITNTTETKLLYISVEYKIYDKNGVNIGKLVEHTHYLDVGETWYFETNSSTELNYYPTVIFSKIETIKS